eukprot:9157537-Heterocapsa_arctica.AAC.1
MGMKTCMQTSMPQQGGMLVVIPFSRVCVHTLFKIMKQGCENGNENAMVRYRTPVRENVGPSCGARPYV